MRVIKLQNNFPSVEEEKASKSYSQNILMAKDKHIIYGKNLLLVQRMF